MVVDSVHMKLLLKYGCTFDIVDCEDNLYFSDIIKGSELFKVLNVGK